MTNYVDAFQAAVDAVVADNTLNKGGFADAIRTVAVTGYSDAEAKEWIDNVLIVEFFRLGIINNATYNSLRNYIIGSPVESVLFMEVLNSITGYLETDTIRGVLVLFDLRFERDEVQTSIDTMNSFKTGATKQVKDALNLGIDNLRGYKQLLRDQIQAITGDPDS